MCYSCDQIVAGCGEAMDLVIAAETEARNALPDLTNQQHTMRLASGTLDMYDEAEDKDRALQELAVGFAVVVTRLIALQELYGAPV